MNREEAIEYLNTSCARSEDLNGPHAYFVVAISRDDIEFYGTKRQLSKFNKATAEGKQEMLDDIASELHEMYEDGYFGDHMREVLDSN